KISVLDSYKEISREAAGFITRQLEANKAMLLCAATGNTPSGTYERLVEEYDKRPALFDAMRVLKLDEWGGIPMTDPGSCEAYLQARLLSPLRITGDRYLSFRSDAPDPEVECKRVQKELEKAGPIDCCVLGLGLNGHIGLNEPAGSLQPGFHLAQLSEGTLGHSMVAAMNRRPSYGLTLGMADILQARTILLLISGKDKRNITGELLSKKITTSLPASFLWTHPNTICLLDKEAYG
ncbi:MAG TPA: galactosamine-6-phosphate isomerase, partial [Puia sp.]|nr:galactosamine-6-phosphate isomerase [Puia sp.]